jgi:hypothetical protein
MDGFYLFSHNGDFHPEKINWLVFSQLLLSVKRYCSNHLEIFTGLNQSSRLFYDPSKSTCCRLILYLKKIAIIYMMLCKSKQKKYS